MIDYNTVRKAFNEQFLKTMELVRNGETHLNNLAEGFLEADRVIQKLLENEPKEEAPVRHGRWKKYRKNLGECSECGEIVASQYKYCPNCGAKMDLEDEP